MSRENLEVIQRMNAAFNTGDYEAMTELFHPEAEFSDLLPLPDVAQSARGRDEIRVILDAWSEGFQGFEAQVLEYLDVGDFVVAITEWRFFSRDKGIEMQWRGAEAWEVRNGKVIWGRAGFRDKAEALEAVGLRK